MPQEAQYTTQSTRDVAVFLDKMIADVKSGATATDVLDSVRNEPGVEAPAAFASLLSEMKTEDESRIFDSVVRGVDHYTREHGAAPTADLIEASLQQGLSAFRGINEQGHVLDSATSARHDQGSLQPNRAVVAILSAIAEACPFAGYLPVDIQSNEARLAILSHTAGSTFGDYVAGGLMDGVSVGDVFTSAQRMVRFDLSGAQPFNHRFTQTNLPSTPGYCDAAGTGVPVLRGRTVVFVNGIPVCNDTLSGSAANSPFTGSVTLPTTGVTYTLAGYVTPATGAVQVTTITPAMPTDGTVEVVAQSVIDYETSPALIPSVGIRADVYQIYANASRVMTSLSMDAAGQLRNELGLDGSSEALMAIRTQMAMERHYLALRMAWSLSANNVLDYDFGYSAQIQQKTRAQIWQDGQALFGDCDQKMANMTMDHGITHLYAPSFVVNQWMALGSDMFVPSGIAARPGLVRAGKLYGKYDVYYSPKTVSQAANRSTATVLAIGRSNQVARNPIIMGDAVAPTFLDLNMQSDLKRSSAMYSRDFTCVNPHQPSALGCARVKISNFA